MTIVLAVVGLFAVLSLFLFVQGCRDYRDLNARERRHDAERRHVETLAYHSAPGHRSIPGCVTQGCPADFATSPSRLALDAQIVAFEAIDRMVDDIGVYLNEFRP